MHSQEVYDNRSRVQGSKFKVQNLEPLNHYFNKKYGKEEMLMKEINELNLPDDVRYTDDHEWARLEGDKVCIGLDDYAQDQLGDIVFVELPQTGDTFKKGEEFATVESVKAVCECYLPVSGEIIAVNTTLEESPELVNKSPYGDGWFVEVSPSDTSEMDTLMTNVACLEKLKGAV